MFFAIFSKTKQKRAYLYTTFSFSLSIPYAPEVMTFKFGTPCILLANSSQSRTCKINVCYKSVCYEKKIIN